MNMMRLFIIIIAGLVCYGDQTCVAKDAPHISLKIAGYVATDANEEEYSQAQKLHATGRAACESSKAFQTCENYLPQWQDNDYEAVGNLFEPGCYVIILRSKESKRIYIVLCKQYSLGEIRSYLRSLHIDDGAMKPVSGLIKGGILQLENVLTTFKETDLLKGSHMKSEVKSKGSGR